MEDSQKDILTKKVLFSVLVMIVGIYSLVNTDKLGGTILIAISLVLAFLDSKIREFLFSTVNFIFRIKPHQSMVNSSGSIQQKAGRDATVNIILRENKLLEKANMAQLSSDRKSRKEIREEDAIRNVHTKMVKAMKILNESSNLGIKNQEEYNLINSTIEDFIDIKMQHEIDMNEDMKKKLDEVMACFRLTRAQLHENLTNGKKECLHGLEAFSFIGKCKEATQMIKERLRL